MALQARQPQAEHAIHARAVAAVQRVQLRHHVGKAHLRYGGGARLLKQLTATPKQNQPLGALSCKVYSRISSSQQDTLESKLG